MKRSNRKSQALELIVFLASIALLILGGYFYHYPVISGILASLGVSLFVFWAYNRARNAQR